MRRIVIGLALAAALSGCGQRHETTVTASDGSRATISAGDGGKVTVTSDKGQVTMAGGNASLPAGLPADVPIYPALSIDAVTSSDAADGRGGIISGHVQASPAQVAAFYHDRLKALGWPKNTEGDFNGGKMIAAGKGENQVVSVLITPRDGGASDVAVTYAKP